MLYDEREEELKNNKKKNSTNETKVQGQMK